MPQPFSDTTEKHLTDAREKLQRIESGVHKLRGSDDEKAKKKEAIQKTIFELEQKLAQRSSSLGSSTPAQIILTTLSLPSVASKEEELKALFAPTVNGPGTEQQPMEIDSNGPDAQMVPANTDVTMNAHPENIVMQ